METLTLSVRLAGVERSPISIFHMGQAFYLAGNRCLLNIDVGPAVTQCLTSPGVVNYCLSLELFFKSIIALGGQEPPKTHRLAELFAALPHDMRGKLEIDYGAVVTSPSLNELLAAVTDYFVKVRYGYEFDLFAFHELPISVLARATYVQAATAHDFKVGHDRINV